MRIENVGFVKSPIFWGLLTTAYTHVVLRIALSKKNEENN